MCIGAELWDVTLGVFAQVPRILTTCRFASGSWFDTFETSYHTVSEGHVEILLKWETKSVDCRLSGDTSQLSILEQHGGPLVMCGSRQKFQFE
jgi:hypothetical protein